MQRAIDYQLASRVNRPLDKLDEAVLRVLRLSAFQLIYLSRLPASAIINDAVELTRRAGKTSAAGLANAVLRALSKDREHLTWPDDIAIVHSHPRWLVDRWIARYGEPATLDWLQFNNRPPALCLAVNRTLTTREALADELAKAGVRTEPTSHAAHGLRVLDGHPLGLDAFSGGRFHRAGRSIATHRRARAGADRANACSTCARRRAARPWRSARPQEHRGRSWPAM